MERKAVSTIFVKGLGLSAATLGLVLLGWGAQAQAPAKKEAAPKAAPAKKSPACNSLKAQTDCEGRTDCRWVGESKDAKGKVKKKAYCQSKPKEAPKK
jgi:hypothetical protein